MLLSELLKLLEFSSVDVDREPMFSRHVSFAALCCTLRQTIHVWMSIVNPSFQRTRRAKARRSGGGFDAPRVVCR